MKKEPNTICLPRLLTTALLTCSLSLNVMAQQQIVTVNLHNVTLAHAIKTIGKQSALKVSYSKEFVNDNMRVSVKANKERVDNVLKRLLKEKGIEYKIENGCIMLYTKPAKKSSHNLTDANLNDDLVTVSGHVRYPDGEPMIGATITVAGSSKSAVTDANGNYTIKAHKGDVLNYSYIGCRDIKTTVSSNGGTVNITLREDTENLNEVVVVAYGTQKKINLTGAVSMVKGDVLESRPVTSVARSLQGELPGVNVSSGSGQPGAAPSIVVRGISTINSDTSPLILIDGVAGGDINLLNPDDIASVSVLKDAASASIYGARAANGVILVTTKTGSKEEKTKFSYSGYVGWQTPTRLPKLVNGRQYMEMSNEAMTAAGYAKPYLQEAFDAYDAGTDPNNYSNTDWINEIYKKSALQTSHNLSVRGGTARSGYLMSYGYLNQDGLVVGDPYKSHRHNVRLEVNTDVNDRLHLSGNISYVDFFKQDSDLSGTSGVFRLAQRISPLLPVKWQQQDAEGHWSDTDWYSFGAVKNPVYVAREAGRQKRNTRVMNGIANASYKLFDGLKASALYSLNYYTRETNTFSPCLYNYYQDGTPSSENENLRNEIYKSQYTYITQNIQATLNYAKVFAKKHDVAALLGYSQEWESRSSLTASRKKVLIDGVDVIDGGTEDMQNSGNVQEWALRSFFGRINYAYDSRYLFEANMRIDGTSRFAKGHRWGYFPSFSFGWNFSREKFMEWAKPALTSGKLRASWGELGNQNVGSSYYPYLTPITPVDKTNPIGGIENVGFKQQKLGNEHIKWETIRMLNFGIDLSFFNNRLTTTFEWYKKNNINALVKPVYPTVIGVTGSANLPFENMGEIENKGWELWLQWRDAIGEVNYSAAFNISDSRNKIVDLGKSSATLGDHIRQEGTAIDAYYGYRTKGLAQVTDFEGVDENGKYYGPKFATTESTKNIVQPGDIIYVDRDKSGVIDDKDKVVLGDQDPHYILSFKGSAQWKWFDASFYLQGVAKWNGYLSSEARHCFINDYSVPKVEHLDHWTPTNTNAKYPRLYQAQTHNLLMSDYWLENASYLRLKNVQLGVTIPKNIIKKVGLERLRFYFSADNLCTFTNYFGAYDPEVHASSGDAYPQVKTFIFGVQTTF